VRPLHVGWYELLPDVSLNFQLNRWAAYGGEPWLADVRPILPRLEEGYDAWRDTFVTLGERAQAEGRGLDAALHFRSAEFFMAPSDPRKQPLRHRLLGLFQEATGMSPSLRKEVPFDGLRLPVWHLPADDARGTIVAFGGFDSYIEEAFPIMVELRSLGWTIFAFEGPGQGAVLEDQHAPMTADWHRPVAAVLDAFGLDDVTLLGVSLGGCLAIRAAAFEPRIRRVVAFDVLTDFLAVMQNQQTPVVASLLQGLLAVGADRLINRAVAIAEKDRPVLQWGVAQGEHVFGQDHPAAMLEAARRFQTKDVSSRVRQDVLLLCGTHDHYVPLNQLWEQARLLTAARSITARVFTAEEHAQAHCQVGNLPLALRVISDWVAASTAASVRLRAAMIPLRTCD
jgi:alpha-beta hydrolase superfamily lysophospholipase